MRRPPPPADLGGENRAPPGAPDSYAEWAAMLPSIKLLAGLLTMAVIIAALYVGRELLIPLALAILLGFLLDPVVTWLKRVGLPRVVAVMVVVGGLLLLLGGTSLLLGQQVRMLSEELPTYQHTIRQKVRTLRQSLEGPGFLRGALQTYDTVEREMQGDGAPAAASTGVQEPPPQRVIVQPPAPTPVEQAWAWLDRISEPVVTAGIVLLFLVLILLGRHDLRDRMLRLMGGNLHRSTDAMDEASRRISRYLAMQLVVNVTYAVPMALGLWLLGVPGAIFWGVLAAVLRFVPYVGPAISALCPIALAFAVDPGWNVVLWTVGLIAVLELVSNNVIEPWLYGASTGISTISLIVAMLFWTALWGPVGLILSTPLTVCLLVLGRYLPQFQFLEVLLGNEPMLDMPTRLYQRLLAGDVAEAIDMASEAIEEADESVRNPLLAFYDGTAIPMLRLASGDHANVASAEHRMRVIDGMNRLLEEWREQHPALDDAAAQVLCLGGRWEADTLAANMLAHALTLEGLRADYLDTIPALTPQFFKQLDLAGTSIVCLSYFSPTPQAHVRYFSRRLRRRWPDLRIVVAFWNAPSDLYGAPVAERLGVDAIATTLQEVVLVMESMSNRDNPGGYLPAPVPDDDAARVRALHASGLLEPVASAILNVAAQRAADIFDVKAATVSLVDETWTLAQGASGSLPVPEDERDQPGVRRELSLCAHVVAHDAALVVPDIARDPRYASNPALTGRGIRFYAGTPLRSAAGYVLGSFSLFDDVPRTMDPKELRLLQALAEDLMRELKERVQPSAVPDLQP